MKNKTINIIRSIDYGAEKEYLKEFFRFIGCFLSDTVLDPRRPGAWDQALRPCNEENGVDIVINYFGEDPYLPECRSRRIKRIYCYFSFQIYERYAFVSDHPMLIDGAVPKLIGTKAALRNAVLNSLISAVWSEDAETANNILNIAGIYTAPPNGDMFFCIQARRSLRFLKMSEVLDVPHARVDKVSNAPYLMQCLTKLWTIWVSLDNATDPYSQYAQVKAGKMIRDIVLVLRDEERMATKAIVGGGVAFQVPTMDRLAYKLQMLIKAEPRFLSAQIYLGGISRYIADGTQGFIWYDQVLNLVPQNMRHYAFIWYRKGYYYEKISRNIQKALQCYMKTVEIDPQYYQALFKLGYYAASTGKFREAEHWLNRMIQAVFHGRSTEAEQNGEYPNWLSLSLKESQYVFKAYMMLAKVAINSTREYSAKNFVGKATLAATRFGAATLVNQVADPAEFTMFQGYHGTSEYVWAIWRILEPWTEEIILDYYLRGIVREKLMNMPDFSN